MNYPTTKRQRTLLALVEPLAREFASRAEAHDRDGSFPFENFAALRAANLHALTAPTEYGGLGADELDYTLVLERVAWGDASTALVLGMHCANLGMLVEGQLWPDRLPDLCREVVAEGALINAAQAEPELGSPSAGGIPATTA
ncbi:MAG TPA: acyl-CoA dehydrogenase family protein, partial [Ktedonobacterales bacterium]